MKAFEVGTHYSKSEFPDVWPFCNCLHYSIIFVNFSSISSPNIEILFIRWWYLGDARKPQMPSWCLSLLVHHGELLALLGGGLIDVGALGPAPGVVPPRLYSFVLHATCINLQSLVRRVSIGGTSPRGETSLCLRLLAFLFKLGSCKWNTLPCS